MVKDEEKSKLTLVRIGKSFRVRVEKVKEYEFIDDEEFPEEFPPFISSKVSYQEFQEAEKLKQRLLKKYEGKRLEDVIPGNAFKTKKGVCYHIENQARISLKIINPERARNKILSNLKLIYGIGDVTERNLKKDGYKTIEDLAEHPRFCSAAKRFLRSIEECDTCKIVNLLRDRFPKSHPLTLCPSGFHEKEDFIFLDMETMGFFGRPIILFGVAQISGDNLLINQYLLRDIREEPAALMGFLSHVNKDSVFITFNGRTFDIPYVIERLAYYRMKGNLEKPHFDILHFSRRAWGERVSNCRLNTLGNYLGIKRKDGIPSALVPDFYESYLKNRNVGPLIPIIEHNKQDLITLAIIFSKLHEKWG